MKITKWIVAMAIPSFLTAMFFYQFIPTTNETYNFGKVLDPKDNSTFLTLSTNLDKLQEEGITKLEFSKNPYSIPNADNVLINYFNLPEKIIEMEHCIYPKSFVLNTEEEEVAVDDSLHVFTGSFIDIPEGHVIPSTLVSSKGKCFPLESSGKVVGIRFSSASGSIQMFKDWGLDIEGKKGLAAGFRIQHQIKPKYIVIYLVMPLLYFATWWGFLIVFAKMKSDFINDPKKQ